jgi:hypothetical protein
MEQNYLLTWINEDGLTTFEWFAFESDLLEFAKGKKIIEAVHILDSEDLTDKLNRDEEL